LSGVVRPAGLLLLALTATLALPAPLLAAPKWQKQVPISPRLAIGPEPYIDDRGNVLVTWSTFAVAPRVSVTQYAWRTPKGRWSAPRTLGPTIAGTATALSASGTAVHARPAVNGGLALMRARPGRRFGTATAVPTASNAQLPTLALDAKGAGVVAWEESFGADDIRVRVAPIGTDGRAGTPQTLAGGTRGGAPRVAIEPSGAALVTWTTPYGDGYASFRPRGGTFEPVQELGFPRFLDTPLPTLATPSTPRIVASSILPMSPYHVPGITYVEAGADGRFAAPKRIDVPLRVELALSGSDGSAALLSNVFDGARSSVWVTTLRGDRIEGPLNVSGSDGAEGHLGGSRAGDSIATWSRGTELTEQGITSRIYVRLRRAGAGFGPTRQLGRPGLVHPRGAINASGHAIVVANQGSLFKRPGPRVVAFSR
jgi:hypothetical protein